ncbi:MAG TPA: adenylosuccinate lyase, partial [Candidatus Kapabacteria bacterium]|nr:adenylosuccinate lyase [Candidatus Kapabacteria bacterium]
MLKHEQDPYDSISPIDYRYEDKAVTRFLSENGFTRYKLQVEQALVRVLVRHNICSPNVLTEVEAACERITTTEVYEEEERIKHDIRALVNSIRGKVNATAK